MRSPHLLPRTTRRLTPSADAARAPTAEPLCLPPLATAALHRSCLWQAALSTVSASSGRAVVAHPTRYTAARTVLPEHLHRARSAAPLCRSHPRLALPDPVHGSHRRSNASPTPRASSAQRCPALPVSCIPGGDNGPIIPTSMTSSLAADSPRSVRHGCLHEPTSLSPCERCP